VAECSASAMDTLPDKAPQGTMQSERLRRTVHYAEYNSAPHMAGRVCGRQRLALRVVAYYQQPSGAGCKPAVRGVWRRRELPAHHPCCVLSHSAAAAASPC